MTLPSPTAAVAGARCFLALRPDTASRQILQNCRATFEASLAGTPRSVRWVEPEALHMTLRFLGPSSTTQIEYFQRVLPDLACPLPALAARRYGIWPNRARPRLLVLELATGAALSRLAQTCEAHARNADFAPEHRHFRAHITLAKLRPGCAFGSLPQPPSEIRLHGIALMQSHLAQAAARYTELAHMALPATHD